MDCAEQIVTREKERERGTEMTRIEDLYRRQGLRILMEDSDRGPRDVKISSSAFVSESGSQHLPSFLKVSETNSIPLPPLSCMMQLSSDFIFLNQNGFNCLRLISIKIWREEMAEKRASEWVSQQGKESGSGRRRGQAIMGKRDEERNGGIWRERG